MLSKPLKSGAAVGSVVEYVDLMMDYFGRSVISFVRQG